MRKIFKSFILSLTQFIFKIVTTISIHTKLMMTLMLKKKKKKKKKKTYFSEIN